MYEKRNTFWICCRIKLFNPYLQLLNWTTRVWRCWALFLLSWGWECVWERREHVLYWNRGRRTGLERGEEPAAGAEPDATDATEDAKHAHIKQTHVNRHTHQTIWESEKRAGDVFHCAALSCHYIINREKHTQGGDEM